MCGLFMITDFCNASLSIDVSDTIPMATDDLLHPNINTTKHNITDLIVILTSLA